MSHTPRELRPHGQTKTQAPSRTRRRSVLGPLISDVLFIARRDRKWWLLPLLALLALLVTLLSLTAAVGPLAPFIYPLL